MKFNASHNEKYDNIVIVGGSSANYLNDMFRQTKDVVKYTGLVSNGTNVSDLDSGLRSLNQYSMNELLASKNTLVIIGLETSKSIKKFAEKFKEHGFDYDYISNYTRCVDVSVLCDLGYNEYIDYLGNDISYEGQYIRNKIKVFKNNKHLINACNNNVIKLGNISVMEKLHIALYGHNSYINIGDISCVNIVIWTSTNGKVTIGDYCMFSMGIMITQSDQHHIFDLNTKERINANKNIEIGNHVWIGMNAQILGGCNIPDNCILGAQSVTSRKFTEKNCIMAGNPAKVIRENIIWSRDNQAYDYQTYDECKDKVALNYLDE